MGGQITDPEIVTKIKINRIVFASNQIRLKIST